MDGLTPAVFTSILSQGGLAVLVVVLLILLGFFVKLFKEEVETNKKQLEYINTLSNKMDLHDKLVAEKLNQVASDIKK